MGGVSINRGKINRWGDAIFTKEKKLEIAKISFLDTLIFVQLFGGSVGKYLRTHIMQNSFPDFLPIFLPFPLIFTFRQVIVFAVCFCYIQFGCFVQLDLQSHYWTIKQSCHCMDLAHYNHKNKCDPYKGNCQTPIRTCKPNWTLVRQSRSWLCFHLSQAWRKKEEGMKE